jgi:hypothetical protein
MESLLDQISKRSTKANPKSKATILAFSILILVAGIASSIGGTNYILYSIANAPLEEGDDLREEQSAVVEESATGPNEFSLTLDRAHFIPLSPISDSPGNQVKKLLQYSGQLPSTSTDDTINAIMEVYAANHTLLRTSSLPEPITLDGSDGTIQLATTFNDPNLKDVTAKALITDSQKINPLSDPIEASIGLGEITSAAVLNKQ